MKGKNLFVALLLSALSVSSIFATETEGSYASIHASNREEIIKFIKDFPYNEYEIYKADSFYYYLDPIKDRIKDTLRKGLIWEKNDVQVFLHLFVKPNTTVVDIGAHIGVHAMKLAKLVAPFGRAIAFEPQPKLFRELYMNMALNQITNCDLYCAAVGNKNGQIELTSLEDANEGATSLLKPGVGTFADLLTVDALKLSNVSLMLIDVEGMEEDVINGATETIINNRPVILLEIKGGKDVITALPFEKQAIYKTIHQLEAHRYHVRKIWGHEYVAIPEEKATLDAWLGILPDYLKEQVYTTKELLKAACNENPFAILNTYDELLQAWIGEYARTAGQFQLGYLLHAIQFATKNYSRENIKLSRSLKVVALLWNEGSIDEEKFLVAGLLQNNLQENVRETKIIQLATHIQLIRELLEDSSEGWQKDTVDQLLVTSRNVLQSLHGTHPKLEQALTSAIHALERGICLE